MQQIVVNNTAVIPFYEKLEQILCQWYGSVCQNTFGIYEDVLNISLQNDATLNSQDSNMKVTK